MKPQAIDAAVPSLVEASQNQIDHILSSHSVVMEEVLTNYTLDVAWKQILGLNLKEDEVETFHKNVNDWIGGITNLRVLLKYRVKTSKAGKAHAFLVSLIVDKLNELKESGKPDGSTLSAMLFAEDEDDSNTKRLSQQEIIDNTLLLILAGSETSASTLTVASLLLGLHPDARQKMRAEQQILVSKHGQGITRELLDSECPYLDAVLKETLRLKPVVGGGIPRVMDETMVLDGKQIPKGYTIQFNIGLTHKLDPKISEPDGSHMDVVKGFHPERWFKEETKPSEYMPFGIGARFCLGYNLAMAEMKVFLALFVRHVDYDLLTCPRITS